MSEVELIFLGSMATMSALQLIFSALVWAMPKGLDKGPPTPFSVTVTVVTTTSVLILAILGVLLRQFGLVAFVLGLLSFCLYAGPLVWRAWRLGKRL